MSIIPAILAFFICTMFGFMSAYRLSARVRALETIIADVRRIKARMEYALTPITQIIAAIDHTRLKPLWESFSQSMLEGASPIDAWKRSYLNTRRKNSLVGALSSDEVLILDELFLELGVSDIESQTQIFSYFLTRAESIYSVAQNESARKSRVFKGVGTLCGVAIAILLL